MPSLQTQKLAPLKDTIPYRPPYCSGTIGIGEQDLVLFYGKKGQATSRLDFSGAPETEVNALAEHCEPATFGLNKEDVLDESYRKAGKLDTIEFAMTFDPHSAGLLQIIREKLLDDANAERSIHMERYKLNVYSQDSFFKAHKDTPRSDKMFGSLVVVLPTQHEGGMLLLRDNGQEFSFDSAKALQDRSEPSIAYIAFYSDVEHEVTKVLSGHRVTITYNLYFDDPTFPTNHVISIPKSPFATALEASLADLEFLPDGGCLALKLQREYVFSETTNLKDMESNLKGNDARIFQICRDLSLQVSLRAITEVNFHDDKVSVLCKSVPKLSGKNFEDEAVWEILCEKYGGYVVGVSERPRIHSWDKYFFKQLKRHWLSLSWVTERETETKFKSTFQVYGNQAEIEHSYGSAYLIVGVGPSGARAEYDEAKIVALSNEVAPNGESDQD